MIQIVVLLKIRNKTAFDEYEATAFRLMKKHGGQLLTAFEPHARESTSGDVDEVHYLQFPGLSDFHNYRNDPELTALAQLREKAISSTEVIVSAEFKDYGL